MIQNAFIRLVDARNKEMCKYNLTENYSGMTAMIFGEIYRYNGEWKFNAVGNGTTDPGLGNSARDLCENKKRSCYGSSFYIKSGNCLSMIEQLQTRKRRLISIMNEINKEERMQGLSGQQVSESKAKYGTNELAKKETESLWSMFIGAFDDIWIKVLCAALALKVILAVLGIFVPGYPAEMMLWRSSVL